MCVGGGGGGGEISVNCSFRGVYFFYISEVYMLIHSSLVFLFVLTFSWGLFFWTSFYLLLFICVWNVFSIITNTYSKDVALLTCRGLAAVQAVTPICGVSADVCHSHWCSPTVSSTTRPTSIQLCAHGPVHFDLAVSKCRWLPCAEMVQGV